MKLKIKTSERGAAFLMVLVAMTMLYLMGAIFTVMVSNSVKKSQFQKAKQKAFFVAESGLMRGIIRRVKYPTLPNSCFGFTGSLDLNENNNGNGTWVDDNNQYTVEFFGVDPLAEVPLEPTDPNFDKTEVKGIRATGIYRDTSGGKDIQIRSVQVSYIQSPFNREIFSTGDINMESRFSTFLACVLPSGWSGENNIWTIYGMLYSKNRPKTDWRNQCCGVEVYCFFGKCGCAWYKWCCCEPPWCLGWRDNMGTRYVKVDSSNVARQCFGYGGDCNNDSISNEAEGEAGGGPDGSWWYYKKVDAQTPFPQFTPPSDPRLPGSGSGMIYRRGNCGDIDNPICPLGAANKCCSHMLKDQRYLRNVWCDGDLIVRREWLDIDFGFGIYGTVYVSGSFTYVPKTGWFGLSASLLKIKTDGDVDPTSPSNCERPPAPGTLIVNKGDIEIMSSGTPDFGRVNMVAVNGNIKLTSYCGMRARGFYYAGGSDIDPVTKRRLGGTITYDAGTWLTAAGAGWICDTLGNQAAGFGIPLHAHTLLYGGFAGRRINLISITPCNVISQRSFSTALLPSSCTDGVDEIQRRYGTYWQFGNTRLHVPEGFYSSVRIFNYRVLQ